MDKLKKRWISIYVENEIGVLARISGLFPENPTILIHLP